jgi:SAM-dependent methyltransferase
MIGGFRAFAPDLAREAPGYNPEYYQILARFEEQNFWFRSRNALILWAMRRYLPQTGQYLEIGCGTGHVLSAVRMGLPRLSTSGSEIFVEGLSVAVQRAPHARLFQMDARRIPFTAAYDLIGAFDVVEHIEDDRLVLSQVRKALKPGGGVILTVPQHAWLWSVQDDLAHHVRRYTRGELERKLREAGFSIRWSSSFVSLLLPALVASRMGRRARHTDPDPFVEFRIPRWLDTLFLGVMRLEAVLIKFGIRFPIGGSRIIVAYRNDP